MSKFIVTLSLLAFLASPTDAHARGTAQKKQNAAADTYKLSRIKDLNELKKFIKNGWLVKIDSNDAYVISKELGEKVGPDNREYYSYARSYTKKFLDRELGAAHAKFGTRYVVTSLVRTVAYQKRLCRSNGNAICGTKGWERSSHLTGATVDISYVGHSRKERKWFRERLKALQNEGKILYIKEYGQACYHVMVLPRYDAKAKKRRKKP